MFTRSSFLHGDPARVDALVDFVLHTVKPATDRLIGNLGLGMWVNRSSGEAVITTVWADDATMRASESAVTGLRAEGAAVLHGQADVERQEILLVDAVAPHEPGNVMRLVRMRCDPATIDANMAWFAREVLPTLRAVPGYLSYVLTADRSAGAMLATATYTDGVAADVAYSVTAPQRTAGVNRGVSIETVTTYEVAIVGIRAPQPPAPRRTIELPAESAV